MRPHRILPSLVPLLALTASLCAPACGSPSAELAPEPEGAATASTASALTSPLTEVTGFGSNPGALKMFEYAPAALKAGAPLVVVLHGCTETSASAAATGWNDVADDLGLAVVYPEQQTANNSMRCFNWAGEYGDPANLQRGKGENLSIKQMVDKAIAAHGSDPARVFVVGFSAGGGTAAIMAATYPDVFKGGGILAGIPYDCTTTYAEVNSCMKPGKTKTAADWAALVKAADPGFAGPWPRMSIWQGSADGTVAPANRTELVKQWAGVHGVDSALPVTDTVDGQSHAVYKNASGAVVVETYEIAGMAHAVPVTPGAKCGTASTYALDKGICAARHLATFFGLTAGASGGPGTPGADAGPGGTTPGSSGALSSSSSTGGIQGQGASTSGGGGGASGGAADPGDGRHGSTCTVGRALGAGGSRGSSSTARGSSSTSPGSSSSSTGALALLGALVALGVTRLRSRARARLTEAAPR